MVSLASGLVIGTVFGFLITACFSTGARKEAEHAAYRRGVQVGYATAKNVALQRGHAPEQDNAEPAFPTGTSAA